MPTTRKQWTSGSKGLLSALSLAALVFGMSLVTNRTAVAASSELAGLASISGSVQAPTPFKAARVYFRNNERRMQYMVYTANGKYNAVYLLPGNYDIRVESPGLQSEVRHIVLKAGKNAPQNMELAPSKSAGKVVSMSEMFPPGPGRKYLTETCFGCHGPDHFGSRQMDEDGWSRAIESMQQQGNLGAGPTPQEREDLVNYLATNFGPDAEKRSVKFDHPVPLDEVKLGKAMYIEYYFNPAPGPGKRRGQDPHFDQQGNVWITDRNIPTRLVKLDPRTGEMKDYLTPHPDGELHGLTIDKDGIVWFPERPGRRKDAHNLNLLAFDPKTEKFTEFPIDPDNTIKGDFRPHTPIVDAQGNVWITMIRGDRFFEWNRETRKITMWSTPAHPSAPYGIDEDSQGNIYMAEFAGPGRIGKYDPKADKFTDFPVTTQPSKIRRVSVDLQDRPWFGIYSRGIIGYVEPQTGKVTEIPVPLDISRPYDVETDYEGNMWFGDDGQGGTTIKYDPRTNEFSFYPTPQVGDQPKVEITRDGAIWYCPRSANEPGTGVLYPDVSKITTLGAYYPEWDMPSSRRALRAKQASKKGADKIAAVQ